ncbi:serine/threonine protein kinase [Peribacillus sp. NJ11]|uniref:serine/threonine protein kinase n=1 Tax=Peribacillus sp. NJ11 TaxID=3055861 RepID=UPI0025A27A59|nr:serine/threonine protein kinase [Peribacillus sp. NJ11]MDM5224419.1 serine/threonine protein kinase [Peribacillus sp. NJ11]
MNDFSSITVTRRGKEEELVVNNPTSYPLIGKGIQGAVFKLTEDRCVKIFLKPKNVKKEKEAMIKGQGLPFMPKFFESGPNYIIMEYIDGPSLRDYLKEQGTISESITQQLVNMKKEMNRLGFTNLDRCVTRHIFVDNQHVLRVVDHANSYDWKPIPVRLLDSLSELGLIDPFLRQVKVLDSELYSEWNNFLSKPRK